MNIFTVERSDECSAQFIKNPMRQFVPFTFQLFDFLVWYVLVKMNADPVKTTDASQSTSESCFSNGKNLGSFGVNRLKKEFFISVKTLNCFFFSIYISNK